MLNDKEVEELYKDLLLESAKETLDEDQQETPLGSSWSDIFWNDKYDTISEEEWLETLEIHRRKRREKIEKYLRRSK